MYKLKLYIEAEEVELFKDETINLNSSVQNISDISKVFTDYTQSFTIPASNNNNKAFQHWYNIDITGGFSAAIRKKATIELNYLPFRVGLMQLNKVEMKNNKPYSYNVTFYGNLVNLSDLFGEDVLNDLDLSDFNHEFNSTNVETGLDGTGLSSGSVIYPLISPERNWLWDSNDVDDIEYIDASTPSTTNGIAWNELKPAIKLIEIIGAIETKYDITFSTDFFNTTTHFDDLFMWCNREEGVMSATGIPSANLSFGGTTSFALSVTSGFTEDSIFATITPEAGYEDVPYTIIVITNGVPVSFDKVGTGGAGYTLTYPPTATKYTTFKVQSDELFKFVGSISSVGSTEITTTRGYLYFTDEIVDSELQNGQMPDMKVGDFIMSLFKMFNLTIIPTSINTFDVMTLDDWYSGGTVKEISKYIMADAHSIHRPDLNNRISFNYNEGDTILAEQYKNINAIGYGDLEADFEYDGSVLDISSQFENIIFERLSSQTDGTFSDIHVGKIINKDLETTMVNPLVFYNRGTVTPTQGIAFISDTGVRSEVTTYSNVGQENDLTDGATTQSLNFGAEVSTWALTVQTESLYTNYWEDYVSDLYDSKRRVFNYKAILPLNVLTEIQLNDILIIRERAYIINTMKINMTSGVTSFELLNYIGEITGSVVNYYFEYDTNIQL